MTPGSLRALLVGVVDYAGLFPPAALDMAAAVANYAEYLASGDAWALGRFVCPVARLGEMAEARRGLAWSARSADQWHVTALLGDDVAAGVRAVQDFNVSHGASAVVDALEARLEHADAIAAAAPLVPRSLDLYVEIPVRDDPAPLVRAIRDNALRAKIRTGGTVAAAFPEPADVVRFMRRCAEPGVAFKATAGLHHPVRGTYRLTYAADAPCGRMFGFLNLLLAAAWIRAGGSDEEVLAVLENEDAGAFRFTDEGATFGGRTVSTDELRLTREGFAGSFGSCSFREPMDDLRTLRVLS